MALESSEPAKRKIRVMHAISTFGIGGTERMLTHTVAHCDRDRFDSCILCFNSPSLITQEWHASGINVFHLNIDKPVSIQGVYRLACLVRSWKPDILIVYGLRANLMARIAVFWCRVPVFITGQRGLDTWGTPFHLFLEKITSRCVDLYIGNSRACCAALAGRVKIPRDKLFVIPNGIEFRPSANLEEISGAIREKFKLPHDAIIVGSIGRLEPIKGYQYLVEAARVVLRMHPRSFFVLVGKDLQNCSLQNRVRHLGIADRFCFPGYSTDVAAWLNCFDIFVLPSLSEGMPVAVLEAMFMGKPVIATDAGGTGELIEHEKTGLLVPVKNPEGIAQAIVQLIENPDLRLRLANAGHARARSDHTAAMMVRHYENKFVELLTLKGKHGSCVA